MINNYFWAKKNEENSRMCWLPLSIHLEDTRRIISRLWEHWLSQDQRDIITKGTGHNNEEEGKKLVEFIAASHDIGKATPAFQMMEGFRNSKDLDDILLERLIREGFGTERSKAPEEPRRTHHSLGGYILLKEFGAREDIASIIGAHHGSLNMTYIDEKQLKVYPSNYYLEEKKDSPIRDKWYREQEKIFNWALEASGYKSLDELPVVDQPAQVILSGLLIMADWIASNESYFPLIDIDEIEIIDMDERIIRGWESWFKNHPWEPGNLELASLYKNRFGFEKPRDVQRVFAELIEDTEDLGIVILEAPMGLGKTEAALAGAEILASKLNKSGIFFGLPTQATSDGIFPRIKEWLTKITEEKGENLSIRLSHGKSALNDDFTSISTNIDMDSASKSVTTNEWFAGRKTSSLDDFVVGTVDNFLLAALKQKHLALRHLGFSRKVVIIDEVHAYDSYMDQYLKQALKWMGAYNVPVIILSATLPAEKREEMVIEYLRGRNIKKREMIFPEEGLRTTAYPLITYNSGNEIKQEKKLLAEDNTVVDIRREEEENLEEIIKSGIKDGANIGLIVNTVRRAQELGKKYSSLLGKDKVDILHSSFIATDRIKKEKELIDNIGKKANRPKGKLIIGTQVIEQSLDIDFDLMISDLAPMDLLIQRIGRLHRHEDTKRPKGYEKPLLYLLGSNEDLDFESGSEAVYGGFLLTRTQYFLPDKIHLPNDISPLVQKVYGEEEIELSEELREIYKDMEEKYKASIEKKKLKAKAFRIGNPEYKNKSGKSKSLKNWLDIELDFQSEEKAYAQVRDIQDTVEIIALKKRGEGYGIFASEEDLSGSIDQARRAKLIARQTLRLPIRYDIDKIIDILEEYNSENLRAWQSQSWLKGSLGIIFDENNEFELGPYILRYDEDYGLEYERK